MPKEDRSRKTYDLPPEVIEEIKALAREYRISQGQLVSYFLLKGLLDVDHSDLLRRLQESKSLYYSGNLDLDDLLDRLKD